MIDLDSEDDNDRLSDVAGVDNVFAQFTTRDQHQRQHYRVLDTGTSHGIRLATTVPDRRARCETVEDEESRFHGRVANTRSLQRRYRRKDMTEESGGESDRTIGRQND